MAYAALTSLNQTIKRLFSYRFDFLDLPPRQLLDFACYEALELRRFLQGRKGSTSRDAFYGEIREAARKLEYALELHLSNQILLFESESIDHAGGLTVDLEGVVNREIISFTEAMKKLRLLQDDEGDVSAVLSSTNITPYFPGLMKSPKIVGLSDEFHKIYNLLQTTSQYRETIALIGMAGIGKTTIALKFFEGLSSYYELCAFVTVGTKCKSREIMLRILAQMNCVDIGKISKEPDDMVAKCWCRTLGDRRFLIVFDDLWSTECFNEMMGLLPYNENGSRILVTTRLWEVARYCSNGNIHEIRFMTEQESWVLLRENVFGTEESCPFELEEAGRKIAEKCDGLPLTSLRLPPSYPKLRGLQSRGPR